MQRGRDWKNTVYLFFFFFFLSSHLYIVVTFCFEHQSLHQNMSHLSSDSYLCHKVLMLTISDNSRNILVALLCLIIKCHHRLNVMIKIKEQHFPFLFLPLKQTQKSSFHLERALTLNQNSIFHWFHYTQHSLKQENKASQS